MKKSRLARSAFLLCAQFVYVGGCAGQNFTQLWKRQRRPLCARPYSRLRQCPCAQPCRGLCRFTRAQPCRRLCRSPALSRVAGCADLSALSRVDGCALALSSSDIPSDRAGCGDSEGSDAHSDWGRRADTRAAYAPIPVSVRLCGYCRSGRP